MQSGRQRQVSKIQHHNPSDQKMEGTSETGQALYQDPNTIQRRQAPTGDLYTQPDKPSRRQPPPPGGSQQTTEMPTYQDPSSIQRQQAPTGDMYAMPQKKPVYSQVNKDTKVHVHVGQCIQ